MSEIGAGRMLPYEPPSELAYEEGRKTAPPGEWSHEQDLYCGIFEGLHYAVIRHAGAGHFCGYVAVPLDHPAGDGSAKRELKVRGGITYLAERKDQGLLWYGFACANSEDLSPWWERGVLIPPASVYRNAGWVLRETFQLAQQLAGWHQRVGKNWEEIEQFAPEDYDSSAVKYWRRTAKRLWEQLEQGEESFRWKS